MLASLPSNKQKQQQQQPRDTEDEAIDARDDLMSIMDRINNKISMCTEEHHRRMVRNNEEREMAESLRLQEERQALELEREKQRKIEEEALRTAEQRELDARVAHLSTEEDKQRWLADYFELQAAEKAVAEAQERAEQLNTSSKAALQRHDDAVEAGYAAARAEQDAKIAEHMEWHRRDRHDVEASESEQRLPIVRREDEDFEVLVHHEDASRTNALSRTRARVFAELTDDVQESFSEMSTTEANAFLDELEEIRLLKLRLRRATSAKRTSE
eukprot:PhM_4_TR9833/c0_g1_i1/m.13432